MKFAVACNWDERSIELAESHRVSEFFGKLPVDALGGGRASFILPEVSKASAEAFVRKAREAGIEFNYLLNATCGGNHEMTRAGHKAISSIVDWSWDIGVRRYTVSIPWLARLVRERRPQAHLTVSMMACVDSVQEAAQWERLGASVLILRNNKDFALIRALRRYTGLELEISANLSCVQRCSQASYHGNVASHSSDRWSPSFCLPVCETGCWLQRLRDPGEIVSGQWIRPEDAAVYEEQGVSRLKILDRTSSTDQIARVLESFDAGHSPDNLATLIPGFSIGRTKSYLDRTNLIKLIKTFARPDLYNVLEAGRFASDNPAVQVVIRAQELEGYLERFLTQDCRLVSCESCGWCSSWAQKAVSLGTIEAVGAHVEGLSRNMRRFTSGRLFSPFARMDTNSPSGGEGK